MIDWNAYSRSHPDWFQATASICSAEAPRRWPTLIHRRCSIDGVARQAASIWHEASARRASGQAVHGEARGPGRPRRRTRGRCSSERRRGSHLLASGLIIGMPRAARPLRADVRVTDAVGASVTRPLHPPRQALAALPDRHLRGLLPDRPAGLVGADAAAARLAAVHPRRELRLLRLVGLALRLPARRLDGRATTCSRSRIHRRRRQSRARKVLLALAVAFDLGLLGYFKYAGFFVSSADNLSRHRRWLARTSIVCRSASPSSPSWRSRTSSTRTAASSCRRRSRASRSSWRSSRTSSPARSCARSELLPQLETPRDPRKVEHVAAPSILIVDRPLHEGRDREPPRDAHRRRRLRGAEPALVARGAGRRLRLRRADLRRLLRLHEHRDRRRAAARLRVPAELRLAVRRRLAPGLLAALAHDAVALAARLPLHPARRQPQGPDPHLPQPHADDAARRALARRRVDVRRLGRDPRRSASRSSGARRAGEPTPAPPAARGVGRILTFHVVCFGWIFFRADSFGARGQVLERLVRRRGGSRRRS